MSQKYLLIYRMSADAERADAPSPAQIEAMMAQWGVWKAKFGDAIVDMGDGLLATGATLSGGVVTDGAWIESKEVIGGYSIVQAADLDGAIAVSRECPITMAPGSRIEIRPLAGY
jgi:hypothetical protein